MTASILPQLEANKGTISSELGKSLAKEALSGDTAILEEAVHLLDHEDKQVRAGAAKIIEQVALKEPAMVVGYLPQILPALNAPEPQTRWMVIHTLGLCAHLDPTTARLALPKAQAIIVAQSGACLWGATIHYLGDLGAVSAQDAQAAFPLLERAAVKIPSQRKNVLVGFTRLSIQADEEMRGRMAGYAVAYSGDGKPSVRAAARRLSKNLE